MAKVFYLSEVVNFAVAREQEAYNLYQQLSEEVQDQTAKMMFQHLMQEEMKHKEFYKEMLEHIEKEQTPRVAEDSEYVAYMQEMIAEARTAKRLSADDIRDVAAAVSYAMEREKDSIMFYVGLKNFVPEHAYAAINKIIAEEGRHLALLIRFKQGL